MNHRYADILNRIKEEPLWWDEYAVPRYCEFGPRENANIYADEIVLLLIQCQDCGKEYRVCLSQSAMERYNPRQPDKAHPSLTRLAQDGDLHYGDPPNNCGDRCGAGSTMNSVPVRVLEFWRREGMDKVRVPELERDVWPDWMPEDARNDNALTRATLVASDLSPNPGIASRNEET